MPCAKHEVAARAEPILLELCRISAETSKDELGGLRILPGARSGGTISVWSQRTKDKGGLMTQEALNEALDPKNMLKSR